MTNKVNVMKSRKADAMKDAGIDPVISDLIFAHKKARIRPGFFVGVCAVRHARFKVFC